MSKREDFKLMPGSENAYKELVPLTDAAQAGHLKPWSPSIIKLLTKYGLVVNRRNDITVQTTISFPTSVENHSIAIGVRYLKNNDSFSEDLFVFTEEVGITRFYRGSQEQVLPEYKETHHRKIPLTETLGELQSRLDEVETRVSKQSIIVPEIALMIRAQANDDRFEIQIVNNSAQALIAETLLINDVETKLEQQFNKLFIVPAVNIPDDVFNKMIGTINCSVHYRTLDGQKYLYTLAGEQQERAGDGRYNVIFAGPASIETL